MDYLFYDIFKEGKTLDDAPLALLRKESEFAWASTTSGETTRFFPSITDEENKVNGAVVHWRGIESPERAESIKQEVPWIKHGFSDAKVIPIGNFTSVSKLFHQGGKYLHCGIAEEGFDVGYPQQGKVLRMKANDRAEVKQYMEEIPSLAEGAAEVDILRAKSHMVWEVFF
ncbi:similar to An01g08750 [Aspergillus luchuensis]|uniref:Similar to An01g08750 n=1 Tax=Aspergillus kawachii TaxID=1069201 RepID=A0A146FMS4_ASPKA|nr:similar to An01g08750 [Aspergillus luchuensis]